MDDTPVLTSGAPVKGKSPGAFALPSLTGYVMGTAVLEKNRPPALFLQSDKRNIGTYLYYFEGFTDKGNPVYAAPVKLALPFPETGDKRGTIFQDANNKIWGIWQFGMNLVMAEFNKNKLRFGEKRLIAIKGLPSGYSGLGIGQLPNGKKVMLFGISEKRPEGEKEMKFDSLYYTPEGFWPATLPRSGIYGALINDIAVAASVKARQLSSPDETYFNYSAITFYNDRKETYAIAGTRMGNMFAYKINGAPFSAERKYVVDERHNILRSPTIHAYAGYVKFNERQEGILVSGEGGIAYYKNTARKDKKGNLIFNEPIAVMQRNPELYGGSLVVPELTDWDGDGLLDIISGNSAGYIIFFKNDGSNKNPVYLPPVFLNAGGEVIHIQPGYREDIQGPGEARWGYTCPTITDWNEDGLPDILTGDSRGKFMVYINRGRKTEPLLEPEESLYVGGMNMHGGWRVKPGAGKLGNRMAYIILDKDNEFHLYWRIDDYNVEDGGKLKLEDGSFIKANRRPGGQVGRANIHLVDWDLDGVTDLLVGTGRSNAIPNPKTGLPYNWGKKNEGGAVLFLRNSGTDKAPVFEFPKMMKYKGRVMLFGVHDCAPTTGYLGDKGTLNLIVGIEKGVYMYYQRKDLSW
ncbi:FG-GAP repeat domain-containing protein [Niabella aurantiaca]|uniref:FG-GAP repeat domain-containing protein n=1 Tax=Niabella aurantiaca TaxID=379900 RepID=UPI0012F9B484|nr:VCBS repeat-containing protein [Niabella aurantiaca]